MDTLSQLEGGGSCSPRGHPAAPKRSAVPSSVASPVAKGASSAAAPEARDRDKGVGCVGHIGHLSQVGEIR